MMIEKGKKGPSGQQNEKKNLHQPHQFVRIWGLVQVEV